MTWESRSCTGNIFRRDVKLVYCNKNQSGMCTSGVCGLNGCVCLVRPLSAGGRRVFVSAPLFLQIRVLHDPRHVLEQRLKQKENIYKPHVQCIPESKSWLSERIRVCLSLPSRLAPVHLSICPSEPAEQRRWTRFPHTETQPLTLNWQ